MTNYQNGANRERRFVNNLKNEGFDIAFRSAGSHSKIDVVAINKENKQIYFIQCKPKRMGKNAKGRLWNELNWLNGQFNVKFKVASLFKEL